MIINIQAFNARGADNRRIYDELDDFQSRRPIDVISSNRPIVILDEPQKMEGAATMDALPKFKPLMILRNHGLLGLGRTVGVALGAVASEALGKGVVNVNLPPFGALGLAVMAVEL